jgi:large subunit ribosomal protein L10
VDRAQKAEVIGGLTERFGEAGVVVVARYQGMTVADMSKLRSQMRAVGASFKVSKNRLAKRAAEATKAKPIGDLLKGPTGIAFSEDPISAPKVAVEYAKTNPKFVILGGVVGTQFIDAKGVEALASLPSARRTPGQRLPACSSSPRRRSRAFCRRQAGRLPA